jgi:cysteinyl-tRNA synthetase
MIAGARVEVAPYKRSPMDFVLWKPSTPDQPGWPSPWGRGRPGWHVECSAMAEALLGREFDIHGGGIDLQFPHHENELAQSRCAHGTERMAEVWMHNGFLQVEGEKMSKSLRNFFTVRDLLNRGVTGEVIRFVLLSTHYRQPMDWTEKKVEEARAALRRWRKLGVVDGQEGPVPHLVSKALADDLNTPLALAELHRLASANDVDGLRAGMALLNLRAPDLDMMDQIIASERELIEELLAERQSARQEKDFARADAIRAKLDTAGVIVMDRPNAPTEWELAPHFDPAKLEALP